MRTTGGERIRAANVRANRKKQEQGKREPRPFPPHMLEIPGTCDSCMHVRALRRHFTVTRHASRNRRLIVRDMPKKSGNSKRKVVFFCNKRYWCKRIQLYNFFFFNLRTYLLGFSLNNVSSSITSDINRYHCYMRTLIYCPQFYKLSLQFFSRGAKGSHLQLPEFQSIAPLPRSLSFFSSFFLSTFFLLFTNLQF
ncbi:hypothetical protein PUN28_011531 [Cardiocondyla obscurior]|uniref:Transmembrane protein n=1 Tax=Cardiocondyla obscurior TaxID=286306 RepID=A0AAW2FH29_9HYME